MNTRIPPVRGKPRTKEPPTDQRNQHQKKVKEGVEATLTLLRTYLEIQLNSGEITQNKQLKKSNRKASKPCSYGRTSSNTTCPHLHNIKREMVGQSDPSFNRGWEGSTKERTNNNQKQKTYQRQHKLQPKISELGRSRRLYH